MIDKILNKLAELMVTLLWPRLEVEIKKLNGVAYRNGNDSGYVQGHEDGYISGHADLIRRVSKLYDEVHKTATLDAYAEAGAIPIEDINEEQFDALVEDDIAEAICEEVAEEIEATA